MKNKFGLNTFAKYMCIVVLVVLFVFFVITTEGKILQTRTLKSIVNQSVTTLMAGLGMIFVISIGGTDMSHGGLIGFSAALSFIITEALGLTGWAQVIGLFVISVVMGLLSGTFIGTINAKFKVPSFMISLSMMIALRGGLSWILGRDYFLATPEMRVIDGFGVKIPILIVMIAIIWFILEYTPFGYYCKAIGENENAIKYAGVNVDKIKIMAFVMSGLMAGVTTLFMVARVGGSENTLATGLEMKTMMALFVAGIPVGGGTRTRVFKLIVGAITVNMLESGLTLLGLTGAYVQLVRGIVLLVMIVLSTFVMARVDQGKGLVKKLPAKVAEKSKV